MNLPPQIRHDIKRAWILVVWLLLFMATNKLSSYFYYTNPLIPEWEQYSPGQDPPWYFITRDFVHGLSALLNLAVAILLALSFFKRCLPYSFMVIWMSILWSSIHVTTLAAILWHTDNILDPAKATTSWRTFEDYRHTRDIVSFSTYACVFVLLLPTVAIVTKRIHASMPRQHELFAE